MNALVIDTECTGIENPEVVEVSWVRLKDIESLQVQGTFAERFKPSKPITLGAMATHHIREKDVEHCPPSSSFKLPEGVDYIIGHNVDFDWGAIGKPDVKRICLLALCRKLWPEADSHSQSAMIYLPFPEEARQRLQSAHSAVVDTTNCISILRKVIETLTPMDRLDRNDIGMTWDRLWDASEEARIPTVMHFGKHRGEKIADVPPDYKAWLLRQPDVDPYLAKALQK